MSVDSIGNCLRAIKPFNLTEAENMQIVNLFPQTIVELHRVSSAHINTQLFRVGFIDTELELVEI